VKYFKALWDLQPDSLSNKFGEDIGKWMKLLTDIKKSRATFDTSETKKEFGPGMSFIRFLFLHFLWLTD